MMGRYEIYNSKNFSLLMVYMFISKITCMLETAHTSLTLFISHSVVKCVSHNKNYYYFEYRCGLLLGRPLQSLWTTVE